MKLINLKKAAFSRLSKENQKLCTWDADCENLGALYKGFILCDCMRTIYYNEQARPLGCPVCRAKKEEIKMGKVSKFKKKVKVIEKLYDNELKLAVERDREDHQAKALAVCSKTIGVNLHPEPVSEEANYVRQGLMSPDDSRLTKEEREFFFSVNEPFCIEATSGNATTAPIIKYSEENKMDNDFDFDLETQKMTVRDLTPKHNDFSEMDSRIQDEDRAPSQEVAEDEVIAECLAKLPVELADSIQSLLDKGYTTNEDVITSFEAIELMDDPFASFSVIQDLPNSLKRMPMLKYDLVPGEKKINIKFNDFEVASMNRVCDVLKCPKTSYIRQAVNYVIKHPEAIMDNSELLFKTGGIR